MLNQFTKKKLRDQNISQFYTLVVAIFRECQRCTACCRWPGDVRLGDGEVARLATFTGMTEVEFIQRFARISHDRRSLSLEEEPDGSCVFLDGSACTEQPVKPQQCRDFPNLWNFPGFEEHCRAIPRLVSAEEYERLILSATGRRMSAPEEVDAGRI